METSDANHLCNPVKAKEGTPCKCCGKALNEGRHVCFPYLSRVEFYRGNCGRVSKDKGQLCMPKPIKHKEGKPF
jgi:hypothetical protein